VNWQHVAETMLGSFVGSFVGSSLGWIWAGPQLQAWWWLRRARRAYKRELEALRKL
jgi:hypothetical protein